MPVIIFDRDINGDYYTASIGVDNEEIGRSAAQYAASLTGKGGRVIEIRGRYDSSPATGRHDGFVAEASRAGLEIVASAYGDWNYEDATVAADSLFNIYHDIDLVYAHNDRMAIAASEVARRHGLDLKVIGIDAAPEIGIRAVADGVIDATFLYPTEGYGLIRTALDILEGRPYERNGRWPLSSAVGRYRRPSTRAMLTYSCFRVRHSRRKLTKSSCLRHRWMIIGTVILSRPLFFMQS